MRDNIVFWLKELVRLPFDILGWVWERVKK